MGCGASSTTNTTSVVPAATEGIAVPIVKKQSGADLALKEALTVVFETKLVQRFGTPKANKKMTLTRLDFVDKIFPIICVNPDNIGLPPVDSPTFTKHAEALFVEMDTDSDGKMQVGEFIQWYVARGEDTERLENESEVAVTFYEAMEEYIRIEQDDLSRVWLEKRGGFTDEEVVRALEGLFKVYDTNGDGVLDESEFGMLMLEIMDARLDALGHRSKGVAHDRVSKIAAEAIIIMMDDDDSGTLDLNEFKATIAESLHWNDERVQAAADRLATGDDKVARHLVEFFQAMTWCVGKFIKSKGGVKRALNLARFFDEGPSMDAYFHQS
jgi:Ca2+-binding EF-hand superfamily protein